MLFDFHSRCFFVKVLPEMPWHIRTCSSCMLGWLQFGKGWSLSHDDLPLFHALHTGGERCTMQGHISAAFIPWNALEWRLSWKEWLAYSTPFCSKYFVGPVCMFSCALHLSSSFSLGIAKGSSIRLLYWVSAICVCDCKKRSLTCRCRLL